MAKAHRVFSHKVEAELLKHPKEWAAIDGDRIIAFGPDPRTVAEAAWAAGVETPLLYRVPDPTLTYYFNSDLRPALS